MRPYDISPGTRPTPADGAAPAVRAGTAAVLREPPLLTLLLAGVVARTWRP